MSHWTETAMQFMGDGQTGVFSLVDQKSNGTFSKLNELKRKLIPFVGKVFQIREFLELGASLDKLSGDFCRPFGQLRYFSSIVHDLELERFKDQIERLGSLFDDISSLASQWNTEAASVLQKKVIPPALHKWADSVKSLDEELKRLRKEVKDKFSLDDRIQKTYRLWDDLLAKNARNTDVYWISLRIIGVEMKRDGFSDLDGWRVRLQKWTREVSRSSSQLKAELPEAARVLENYCKLKHLQKVMSLW